MGEEVKEREMRRQERNMKDSVERIGSGRKGIGRREKR